MPFRAAVVCCFLFIAAPAAHSTQSAINEKKEYVAKIQKAHQLAERRLRGPFSPLAKIQTHRLKAGEPLKIGHGEGASARLLGDGVAPLHAVIEGDSVTPTVRAISPAKITLMTEPPRDVEQLTLKPGWGFRIGRFVFEYNVTARYGRMIQVFDPVAPAVIGFKGLDFFPIDPSYRVEGVVVPHADPPEVELVDSRGGMQKHWVYGEVHFTLQNRPCRLELYRESLEGTEGKGFLLIFTDLTSGRETYPAARYLTTGAPVNGKITLDFNLAENPPCVFSPLYSCPFPRKENRLNVAVRAGAQWYQVAKE